ncbi:MAG TPA: hypothetical protein VEG35_06900, partial [Burkholderiales bacterium]|nr:hypothetical protein [Burkholderiales bacterium]
MAAHLERCPLCREEFEGYRSALARAKAAAREESAGDWTGAEWKALIARITSEKTGVGAQAFGLRPRWALASGIAVVILLAA